MLDVLRLVVLPVAVLALVGVLVAVVWLVLEGFGERW